MSQGLTGLLHTALDGLAAQSFGLQVTGQNITNVNTPGYARRDPQLQTRGQGLTGVDVTGMRRVTDAVVERRQLQTNGLASAASERDSQLSRLEALFDDAGGSGLGDALSAFYGSFSGLANNPTDPTARANVLARAEALTGRIRSTADEVATGRNDLLTKAQDVVKDVNERAGQLVKLNQQIVQVRAAGGDTSNLEDQRQQVLLGLAPLIDVTTITQESGAMIVQASGTTLVDELSARTLSIDLAPGGDLRLLAQTSGGSATDVSKYLTGGKLAGIKEARDVDFKQIATNLDAFALGVANQVNAQHTAGFGLDGVGNRAFFDVSGGNARTLKLSSQVAGNPNALAAASTATTAPGGSDNAVLLSRLSLQPAVGSRPPTEAYSDLVGDVGQRKRSAADNLVVRDAVAAQVTAMRESTSGVSLDEEMVALSKYQRAYEASAKVISTVDQLLEELIARLGR
ncbi:MAG TPA: flagellar hook-associated protein FlgK [Polyangiaceae bacterium]